MFKNKWLYAITQLPRLSHRGTQSNLLRTCFIQNARVCVSCPFTIASFSSLHDKTEQFKSLTPISEKLQNKTIELIQKPLGQWTSHEVTTAHNLVEQWLTHDEQSRQTVNRATQIFRRWLLELENGNPLVRQNEFVGMLHRILFACLSVENDQNYKNSKRLVETMERIAIESDNDSLLPGDKAYSILLQILTQNHGTEPETCRRIEKMLEHRLEMARGRGCDLMMWNAALHALAENSPYNKEAAEKAENILKSMSVEPNMISFTTVLNSLARSKSPNAAYRAHTLLENMLGNERIEVNNWSFNVVINALSTLGSPEAAQAAEELLWKLVQLSKTGKMGFEPDIYTFSSLIKCWARSGAYDAAERAEHILRLIPKLADSFGWTVKRNQHSYHTTIDAWANSGRPDAVRRAEILLQEMEQAYCDGDASIRPNEYAYTTVIKALARSRDICAGERAEKILFKMEEQHNSGTGGLRLNSICYSATINAWAKSKAEQAPDRALAILRRVQLLHKEGNKHVYPTTSSYNATIAAFAHIGDSATAISLMDEMTDQHAKGLDHVAPNIMTYAYVLTSLVKSRARSSAAAALEILDLLETRYDDGDTDSCPLQGMYIAVIKCLGNDPGPSSAEQAEMLFWTLQSKYEKGHDRCQPNGFTLAALLNTYMACAHVKIPMKDAPARATAILEWAEQEAQRGNRDLQPNLVCYNSLLGIWATSQELDSLQKVTSIVKMLKTHPDPQMAPDETTYRWLMTAIAGAKAPEASLQCHRILRNMISIFDNGKGNQAMKPTQRSFDCVLEVCLLPNQSDDSKVLILRDMANQLQISWIWKPTSETFVLLFRALASLNGEPDMILARALLKHATSLNLVNSTNEMIEGAFENLESKTFSWSSRLKFSHQNGNKDMKYSE